MFAVSAAAAAFNPRIAAERKIDIKCPGATVDLSGSDAAQLYWRRQWRTGCIRQGSEIGGGALSASSYKDVRIIRAERQAEVAFVARWTAVVSRPDLGAGNPVVGERHRRGVPGLHSVDEDNVSVLQPGNIESAAIVAERGE